MKHIKILIASIIILVITLFINSPALALSTASGNTSIADGNINDPDLPPGKKLDTASSGSNWVFIPIVQTPRVLKPRVNAPYFNGDIRYSETAIFWFGDVTPTDNYADVRVGYNDTELFVNVSIFDRRHWYDTAPTPETLTQWDAVSLYVNLNGDVGSTTGNTSYKFDAQVNWWEARDQWQAGYQGNGSGWSLGSIPFTTVSVIRGNAPNDTIDDHGWIMTYHIPFSSLGLSGPPAKGTVWGLAVVVHDRDDEAGTPIPDKYWPENYKANQPSTWGQLSFGIPIYAPSPASTGGTVTIRNKLNGMKVVDAAVGGHTICGGPHYFNDWGNVNYAGYEQMNIQNQYDVADWPCFSKYYVTFPLNALPKGKVILSAKLRLYEFGNSGQESNPGPIHSLIQVSTINQDWDENTLTWNNAPLASENVSQAWVDPVTNWPGWPGIPWDWDLSRAVADAYQNGQSVLRLVLYDADADPHSGKYFITSDTGDWNAVGRPTLTITWGDPASP